MALKDTAIRNAKPKDKLYRLRVDEGLYIEVTPQGKKLWRFRYKKPMTGKYSMAALGSYPVVTLKAAKAERDKCLELLAMDIDPIEYRKEQQQKKKLAAANTFQAVAEDWKEQHLARMSPAHLKRTWSIVERCILPYLGNQRIAEITAPEILKMARVHEKRGTIETARRAIQTCGQIFRHGIVIGACLTDPTPALKGAIQTHTKKHMAATTDPLEVGGYLRAFDSFRGTPVVAVAIRLLPLLFCRPGELRTMRWKDIDHDAGEWRYTASKTDTDHLVPLSKQALALLEELYPLTAHLPGGWVFIGGRSPLRPMSEAAINAAYRRLGIDTKTELTGHGWRAVARTLLHEKLGYPPEVIEHQLAHAVPDTLGRAYNRTRFIEQRREMMQAWADYLDSLKQGAEVLKFPDTK